MKDFEKLMQAKRFELGLTLDEVAAGICSVSYLSMIEAGKRAPSKKIAKSLAFRLGIVAEQEDSVSGAFLKTSLAIALGKLDEAESLARDNANLAEREFLVAEIKLKQGFSDDALKAMKALLDNESAPSAIRLKAGVSACYCAIQTGDYQLAIHIGERALELFHANGNSDDLFELKATLSGAYTEVGNLNRAFLLVSEPVEFQTVWQRVLQLWAQQNTLENQGKFQEAETLVSQALELLRSLEKPAAQAHMLQVRSWLQLQNGTGNIQDLRDDLSKAEEIFRNLNHSSGLAACLDTRSLVEIVLGDKEIALEKISQALDLVTSEDRGQRAKTLVTASKVYRLAGNLEMCMRSLLEARELLSEGKASRAEARTWRMMADIYEELGDNESVIACLKASTDLLGLSSSVLVVR